MGDNRIVFWELQQAVGGQAISGAADGVTAALGVFTSVAGAFVDDGVVAGDILTIVGGADAGTYHITIVTDNHTLTVAPVFPAPPTVGNTYTITSGSNFLGLPPARDALQTLTDPLNTPQYGCVHYTGLMRSGLFDFEAFTGVASPPGSVVTGREQWGTNPLIDWIRVVQFRLYLDLATPLTALTFDIISPEGDVSPIFLKGWDTFYNVGVATGSGDQDSYVIQHQDFVLRPGSSLRLITAGADPAIVQAAEVWWERERQVVPNTHGDDYFAYNG
jgi:hypothetical protein